MAIVILIGNMDTGLGSLTNLKYLDLRSNIIPFMFSNDIHYELFPFSNPAYTLDLMSVYPSAYSDRIYQQGNNIYFS